MPSLFSRAARFPLAMSALAGALLMTATAGAAGKPGYPDKVQWSGLTWSIKTSRSAVGPGPNLFDKANVSVDGDGNLRLRIVKNAAGQWTCAEVIGPTSHGYGTYTFDIASPVHAFDPNVVLGLFTWSDRAQQAHREIDIEFAKWGNAADPTNAQFVVQPWDALNHLYRFVAPTTTNTRHTFEWRPGHVTWHSFETDTGTPVLRASYSYAGADVPSSRDERVRLNLWLFQGQAPVDGKPVEVVVRSFGFQK
jgi:hypothetical protein